MKVLSKLFLLLVLLGLSATGFAEGQRGGDPKGTNPPAKTMKQDMYDFISINNILMWISNNGSTSHNPSTDASGLEWPKGSGKNVVFQDGLLWGGLLSGELRIGGSTYRQGLQAGPIKADGSAADPADPRYRVYKVRKANRAVFDGLTEAEQIRLKTDFMEWPVADGVRWIDSNNNGVYDPKFENWLDDSTKSDKPWFVGDEVIWFVSNDKDPSRSSNLYGTSPVGMEVHTLVWAYEQTGPLGNMIFEKMKIINKGTDDLVQTYMSQWTDPDLGDANDDFCGVDTTLVLGYVYNGLPTDGIYGTPPAMGYDFFQGPMVPGGPGDVAHFDFGLRPGFKNLGVSSFAFYINGSGVYQDPALGTPAGGVQMYNYMKGLIHNGNPFIDPVTGLTTKITLAGDPVTRTGWIDGNVAGPNDRRFLMTAGPFTLAKGDTQEIVVGKIVAKGADRISSVQVLKYYDKFAQRAFDQNFDLFKPPPAPNVKVTGLDKRIVLSWGDQKSSKATEEYDDRGYKFQGYNIYQFPTSSSLLADAKRIATYDLIDNVLIIFDDMIDEKSGAIISAPAQFGNDTGMKRFIDLTTDYMTDKPLVNNQPFYYAITAYSYNPNPEAVPKQLESTPKVFEARPQLPDPGYRFGSIYNEKVPINHPVGYSTGTVNVNVIDPMQLTGDTYEVTFTSAGKIKIYVDPDSLEFDDAVWNLTRLDAAKTQLVTNSAIYGDESYYIVDGFKIGLSGIPYYKPGEEILRIDWKGGPEVYDANTPWELGSLFFGSAIADKDVNKTVEIRFSKTTKSKGYDYLRMGTPTYGCIGYNESAFTVWDISNPAAPRQLQYAFVENNEGGKNMRMDNEWDPVDVLDREYLFILDKDYSDTPDPVFMGYKINSDAGKMPILYAGWFYQKAGLTNFGVKYPWREGDSWVIVPNVPFSLNDKFTFTTMKSSYTNVAAQADINQINVFPNPYLGANAQELNKYQRFVTFNHLPPQANFRVFTVSGTLVRSFQKNDGSQLAYWDLQNDNGLPVASGMYIIHIDMPELGVEKILKVGVVLEAQYLDRI